MNNNRSLDMHTLKTNAIWQKYQIDERRIRWRRQRRQWWWWRSFVALSIFTTILLVQYIAQCPKCNEKGNKIWACTWIYAHDSKQRNTPRHTEIVRENIISKYKSTEQIKSNLFFFFTRRTSFGSCAFFVDEFSKCIVCVIITVNCTADISQLYDPSRSVFYILASMCMYSPENLIKFQKCVVYYYIAADVITKPPNVMHSIV